MRAALHDYVLGKSVSDKGLIDKFRFPDKDVDSDKFQDEDPVIRSVSKVSEYVNTQLKSDWDENVDLVIAGMPYPAQSFLKIDSFLISLI